ncbi:MAG: hypothetical protein GQ559_02115, partial [Desulfobulbaceae bacterium]|nr:hypothetical protein [Desulfobulbaceae bacterium]
DPGSWQEEWQDDLKKVTLMHDTPFKDGQLYNLTIDVIGEQPKRSSFTAKDRSPSQKITHDLNKGKIDINQAVTYHLILKFFRTS